MLLIRAAVWMLTSAVAAADVTHSGWFRPDPGIVLHRGVDSRLSCGGNQGRFTPLRRKDGDPLRGKYVSDVLLADAALVKRLTDRRKLVGVFFGYGSLDHTDTVKVMDSGDVDYFCQPTCFHDPEILAAIRRGNEVLGASESFTVITSCSSLGPRGAETRRVKCKVKCKYSER